MAYETVNSGKMELYYFPRYCNQRFLPFQVLAMGQKHEYRCTQTQTCASCLLTEAKGLFIRKHDPGLDVLFTEGQLKAKIQQ